MIRLDRVAAENFIVALTGSAATPMVFQLADDTGAERKKLSRVFVGTLAELAEVLERMNNAQAAVWVQVNAGKRGIRNITGLRALFVEDDGKSPLPPLPRLPPSIIVQSSANVRKRHYYWLLRPGEPLERFTPTQKQLIAVYDTDKSINNLDRVMRLPGSWNWKYGEPQQAQLLYVDPSRRFYSIDEMVGAHPMPMAAQAELLREAQPEIHTEQAMASAKRVAAWLADQETEFVRVSPISFRLKCIWNKAHGDKLMIRVQPRGGFWAGCWHDSCGGNANRWPEVRDRIGGWYGPATFTRGDDVEVGQRLLMDLAAASEEPVIADRDKLWRYQPLSGLWEVLEESSLQQTIAAYAGARVGEKNRLRLTAGSLKGAITVAKALAARPSFFDESAAGISFRNGFLAVVPGGAAFVPHSAEHRQAVGLPFDYGQAVEKCPRWERYLAECFEGDSDAQEKIAVLQEFLGACLVGVATQYQKALMLVGDGENGKSVFTAVALALFPPNMRACIKPQDFGNEYMRAKLAGVRLNAVSETPEAEILSSDSFKGIVTGDMLTAREPYGAPFDYPPVAGHLFAANRLPGTGDHSQGFWRRFIVITWNRTFPPERRETGLAAHLIASELPAIAAWAAKGAGRLLERGKYTAPASAHEAMETWQRETNPVKAFVEECSKPDEWGTPSSEIYSAFRIWGAANGYKVMTHASFGRRMRAVGVAAIKRMDCNYYPVKIFLPKGMGGYLVD